MKTFMVIGLVGKFPSYDRRKGRTVMAYRAITQPIPARRTDNPSLWSVTYQIYRWWTI